MSVAALAAVTVAVSGCRDDWSEMNQNPSQIASTNPGYLLNQAILDFEFGSYTYWFYNEEDIFRYVQYGVPSGSVTNDYNEMTGFAGNSLGNTRKMYFNVVNNLESLSEEEKEGYAPAANILDVLQIFLGLQATDMSGDISYTEAYQAQFGGSLTPSVDRVKDLYDLWLNDLDKDIAALTSANQEKCLIDKRFDQIFAGDLSKWAKLANSIKLKIAIRLVAQDAARANQIAQQVATASCGYIDSANDNFIFCKTNKDTGGDYCYHFGNGVFRANVPNMKYVEFMKANEDPRIRFQMSKNSWNAKIVQAFFDAKKISNVPSYIMENIDYTMNADGTATFNGWKGLGEPWVRYYGVPDAFNARTLPAQYGEWFDYSKPERCQFDTEHTYRPFSLFQEEMIRGGLSFTLPTAPEDPIISESDPQPWWGMYMTEGEVNLYLAEFALRGASLPQSAQAYFTKGVKASVEEYDYVAGKNDIPYYSKTFDYDPFDETIELRAGEIDAMLSHDVYKLNGSANENMEKVALQQIIHFYLNPMEMFVTGRRTGVPTFSSNLLPRTDYAANNMPVTTIGRREPKNLPNETSLMYQIYLNSLQTQGFSTGTTNKAALNSERVWQDQGAPQWGAGPGL